MPQKITETDHDSGVNGKFLSGLRQNLGELGHYYHQHQSHHHHESGKHESRINQSVSRLRLKFVIALQIIGEIRKNFLQFSGLFPGTHHVHVKVGKNVRMPPKGLRQRKAALDVGQYIAQVAAQDRT